jgi:hypothetical protein
LETPLFASARMRKRQTLSTGDLTGPLQISAKQERELFSRLARTGLIARVRRGLYLVPSRLPLGGQWRPDEALALNALMDDQQGAYQLCGPNAFNRYGFDDQVPARWYAYNNRLSGDRAIGTVALTLIKVADQRLGRTEEVQTAAGLRLVYASRVRTLLDAVYAWSRFNSWPRGYEWIRGELGAKRGVADRPHPNARLPHHAILRAATLSVEISQSRSKTLARRPPAHCSDRELPPWPDLSAFCPESPVRREPI